MARTTLSSREAGPRSLVAAFAALAVAHDRPRADAAVRAAGRRHRSGSTTPATARRSSRNRGWSSPSPPARRSRADARGRRGDDLLRPAPERPGRHHGAPADPATIADKAKKLFDFAVQVTGCATPLIAENELFGAQTPTPWSATNAQYRANVLALLQDSKALGATPAITIANPPYTGGEAARLVAAGGPGRDPDPPGLLHVARARRAVRARAGAGEPSDAQGHARRSSRTSGRSGSPRRVALELQFQSAPGQGAGRAEPKSAWLEFVKLEALAAKQVAADTRSKASGRGAGRVSRSRETIPTSPPPPASISGRGTRSSATRRAVAGAAFDPSLTEGQIALPPARAARSDGRRSRSTTSARLAALTGDLGRPRPRCSSASCCEPTSRSTRRRCSRRTGDRSRRLRRQRRALPRCARRGAA